MNTIHVTAGVTWVSVPEADLRILCGCPADVVKHLMFLGLISEETTRGVRHETGPNAILLADTSTQNGGFCNLAEFPMLQIFFRQGTLIPGHPRNDGRKPILIGAAGQLRAQIAYMENGKYGSIDRADLTLNAGSAAVADAILAMKKYFNFGKLERVERLVRTVTVDKEAVEVVPGVRVRRRGLNVFEFERAGERVVVDLNLGPTERYEPAVMPESIEFEKEYFSITHIGEGDGFDAGRPCMGSLVSFQGRLYLVDAGPHVVHSLKALGVSPSEIDGVFQTHAHDDHFAGLPTLAHADHKIGFYATPLVRAAVFRKAGSLMGVPEQRFASYFDVHDLVPGEWNDIDGLEVLPFLTAHPVETNAFVFRAYWEGGFRTYAHLADIAPFRILDELSAYEPSSSGSLRALCADIKARCLEPADVKKIDAGAGMIHGELGDFFGDGSGRLLASHAPAIPEWMHPGAASVARFGSVNVLIGAKQDYSMRAAWRYLESYFPGTKDSQRQLLLNRKTECLEPETVLVRAGEPWSSVYLVLGGLVERRDAKNKALGVSQAGSFLGEREVLAGEMPDGTWVAASHVRILRIPAELYLRFLGGNDIVDVTLDFQERMALLRRSRLFGETISSRILGRIARAMERLVLAAGEVFPYGSAGMCLVAEGSLEVRIGGFEVDVAGPGESFGEESLLLRAAGICEAVATVETTLYTVPASVLEGIPVVEWKLLETYERRITLFGTRVGG